jgi:hypothetical protein
LVETGDVTGYYTVLGSIQVTFQNAIFAKADTERYAFLVGTDQKDRTSGTGTSFDSSDNWFITDQLGGDENSTNRPSLDPGTNIIMNFSSAVNNVSFDIADLDLVSTKPERLTVTAWTEQGGSSGGGSLVTTYTAFGNQSGFGDGSAKNISIWTAGFKSIEIDVSFADPPATVLFGFGIDNVTVVPTPGAFAGLASMAVVGLVGVGLRRWRRR